MKSAAKSEIARFAPGRVVARNIPSVAIGLCLAAGALVAASNLLESGLSGSRSLVSGPFMLVVFALAAVCVLGRGLVDAGRWGPAVEIENDRLRAFTVGFSEMPLSEVTDARPVGRGKASRVVVFGQAGPRLVIRTDLMNPSAREIADAIKATIKT